MVTTPALFLSLLGLLGSLSATAPWPTLGVALLACCCGVLLGMRTRWLGVGVLIFVVTGVRAQSAVAAYSALRLQIAEKMHGVSACEGRVTVLTSPILSSGRTPKDDAHSLWLGRVDQLQCGGLSFPKPQLARLASEELDLARGDQLQATFQLGVVQYFQNEGSLAPAPSAARREATLSGSVKSVRARQAGTSLTSYIDRFRAHVRRRISATFRRDVIPLARALVLGENDLSDDEALAFSKSGLMHILAVSGTHLVLAVVTLERALFALLVRIEGLSARCDVARFSGTLGTLLAFLYADFAGGSGSARRAAFMLAIVLGGRALGYRPRGTVALGGSIGIGLLVDPLIGFDISFLLSALATLGLLFLAPLMTRPLARVTWGPGWFRSGLTAMATTLASSLACAPLLAFLGGQMTVAALAANLIAGPAGELLALPACLLHAVSSVSPALERGLAILGGGALYVVRAAALTSASFEALAFDLPVPNADRTATLAASVLGVESFIRAQGKKRGWVAACVFASLTLVRSWAHVPEPLSGPHVSITALDVGQGDALFLEFPSGQVGILDGGGYPMNEPNVGRRVLLPFLRSRRVKKLDFLALSHADRDHLLGLLDVAAEVPVGEFWYPTANDPSKDLAHLLELLLARGTRLKSASELCGTERYLFGTTATVLGPCDALDELGRNDGSLALRLTFGTQHALLTGDMELPREQALLETTADLRANFLKVAHHGSVTSSTPDWLERVRPEVAFISVGIRNSFGHPSSDVLDRFEILQTRVYRTDRLGRLTWTTDGTRASVSSYVEEPEAP